MSKTTPRRNPKQTREFKLATRVAQPSQAQQPKLKYNSKLVCRKVGHSARDCYYRNTATSANKSVSYPKQSTEENTEGTLDRILPGSTTQTNCPTQPITKLKMQRRLNDTMTLKIQKASKATSASSTRQKCAP